MELERRRFNSSHCTVASATAQERRMKAPSDPVQLRAPPCSGRAAASITRRYGHPKRLSAPSAGLLHISCPCQVSHRQGAIQRVPVKPSHTRPTRTPRKTRPRVRSDSPLNQELVGAWALRHKMCERGSITDVSVATGRDGIPCPLQDRRIAAEQGRGQAGRPPGHDQTHGLWLQPWGTGNVCAC